MDLLMSMLSALAALAALASAAAEDFKAEELNSSEAVNKLRRQLMKDNYDYVVEKSTARAFRYHAESEEGEPLVATLRAAVAATTLETPVDFYTKVTSRSGARITADVRDLRRNPMYDQRSKYVAQSDHRVLATAGADKALYADDNEERRQNDRFTLTVSAAADTTVTYTLLKVGAARRSGRWAHLVKAEKPGEVSILNLGEGAVPQFRLPRPRAQYMRDSEPDLERDARRQPLPAVDLD